MNPMLFALFVFSLQDETALPKIAEVESFSGAVELVDPKGKSRPLSKMGLRIKNSDVRDEDKLSTSAGAQAVIVFPDKSRYTLKEKSQIQILQKTLPKPTPEGNTVGRRIRLLFGDIVSEVMPNKEVRTDFESPAGSAAVRGTILVLGYDEAKHSMSLRVDAGTVRYLNETFSTQLDVPQGAAVRFTLGSLDIQVEAGEGIVGSIGAAQVQLDAGDHLLLNTAAQGTIDVGVLAGELAVFNPGAHAFQPTAQNFQAPPPPTDAIRQQTTVFSPTAPTFAPPFPPPPSMPPPPPPGMLPPMQPPMMPPPDSTQQTTTTVGTTTTSLITIIDDFNRPDGPDIGNGWFEEKGNWNLVGGFAQVIVPPFDGYSMVKEIGAHPVSNLRMGFAYSAPNVKVGLEVVGPFGGPCEVAYLPFVNGGTVNVQFGMNVLASKQVGVLPAFTPASLGFSWDGTNLCGGIASPGLGGGVCAAGSSFT